ncbi:MAG: hypothetical protein QQN63_08680 [Nitrosopumilus sp.]
MAGRSTSTSKLPKSIKWLGKRATLLVQYLGPGTYTAEYCYKKWPSKYVGYNTHLVVFRMAVTRERVEEQLLAWVVENKLIPVAYGDKST